MNDNPTNDPVVDLEALNVAKLKFDAFVRHAAYGYAELDPAGVLCEVNPQFCRILGYEREQILGKHFADFMGPSDLARAQAMFRRVLVEQSLGPRQYQIRCHDGSFKAIALSSVRVTVPRDGTRLLYVAVDVTERARALSALRESETRLNRLLENLPDVVLIADPEGRVEYINSVPSGRSKQEIIGTDGMYFLGREDRERAGQTFRDVVSTRECRTYGVRDLLGRSWHCRLIPILADGVDDRQVKRVMVICTDVTQTRLATQALEESEARYRLIAENVTDFVWTGRFDGLAEVIDSWQKPLAKMDVDQLINHWRFTFASPSVENFLGYRSDEMAHLGLRDLFTPTSITLLSDVLRSEFELESRGEADPARHRATDLEHIRRDGRRVWGETVMRFLRGDDLRIEGVEGVTRDITERKDVEREISTLQVRQQQQMAQQLHDEMGQDLLGLRLLAESVKKTLAAEKSSALSAADELAKAAEAAQNRVREIIKGVQPVDVDSNGLMEALYNLVTSTQRLAQIPCVFQCQRPVPVDDSHTATQLYYIAQEAVRNAVKHAHATRITVGLTDAEHQLTLWVRDDGVGIEGFDELTAGMGLSIMRQRATVIGAKLTIEPGENGGMIVTCTLPVRSEVRPR
jgi:PAS domain S-box-containing protein